MIKRIKQISFHKENQSSAFLKSRGCNGEQLSLQFCLSMTSQIDLLRSSIEENDQLYFCCRGRIEIKYLFSWLLQNNLPSVDMLFLNSKALANTSALLFQTTFLYLRGYSAINMKMHTLFKQFIF